MNDECDERCLSEPAPSSPSLPLQLPKVPLDIVICAKNEACDLLRAGNFDALISINDPEFQSQGMSLDTKQQLCKEFQAALDTGKLDDQDERPSLFLWFWDTRYKTINGPNDDHVQLIRNFALSLPVGTRLLVHCVAGVSRSTAAAIISLAVHGMPVSDATNEVKRIRSIAMPNTLLLKLAFGSKNDDES